MEESWLTGGVGRAGEFVREKHWTDEKVFLSFSVGKTLLSENGFLVFVAGKNSRTHQVNQESSRFVREE